ncbi:MAG: GNAT family N-acetyltransferase [Oscillospiraceae bacterium]|nr:GNAT family N-acetyltransferase [Oscillospiraceae bacterium]
MSIIIRKVQIDDVYDYAITHINCWKDAYKGIISDEHISNMYAQLEERVERCRHSIENLDGFEYYCAINDDDMIGRLIFSKCRDEDKLDAGEIGAIYLIAEHWDKGYGKQMLEFALSELSKAGYEEIVIWVLEANKRARRFYEKHGFVQDGTTKKLEIDKKYIVVRYIRKTTTGDR